jgi:tRNA dimethylallyltransferase
MKPRLIIIAGPTGVGKSATALALAREFGGEIISADSMQVYRFMDIGTAKPSPEDRALVRHHMIDVVNPDEAYNAALYAEKARGIVQELHKDKKNIWVAGGTGLYIRVLTGGLLDGPGSDESIRNVFRQEIERYGTGYLHERLKEKDTAAAKKIHPNDAVRLMRALEVIELSGESIVARQREHRFSDRPYECLKIGLMDERDQLYEKIDRRCDGMIEKGLAVEVEDLLARGFSESLKAMQSLGYRHMLGYIKGNLSLGDAAAQMKRDTRNYAKRQMTWFRADGEMNWFHPDETDGMRKRIEAFFSSR